jgi:hypothetical protein
MRAELQLALLGNVEVLGAMVLVTGFSFSKAPPLLCYVAAAPRPMEMPGPETSPISILSP